MSYDMLFDQKPSEEKWKELENEFWQKEEREKQEHYQIYQDEENN